MKNKAKILTGILAATAAVSASAGDFLYWQDNSASVLYGDGFELDPSSQTTLTLEHASGWSFGDMFIFLDLVNFNNEESGGSDSSYYGEIAPRFSIGKITGKDLSFGILKDVLVATTYEFGRFSDESLLVGLGLDFAIPGFDYFQINGYRRINDMSSENEQYQITPVWRATIPVAETSIVFDGYIDYVFGEGTDSFHFNPQVKLDIGAFLGMEKSKLYAGVEYDYWKNKYGVRDGDWGLDTDQSAISGIIQFHF